MVERISRYLNNELAALLAGNFTAMERDPADRGGVAALVHLRDKLAWGVLPSSCRPEIMGACAAQIACTVSGKYQRMEHYRQQLAPLAGESESVAFPELVWRAMALGFERNGPPRPTPSTGRTKERRWGYLKNTSPHPVLEAGSANSPIKQSLPGAKRESRENRGRSRRCDSAPLWNENSFSLASATVSPGNGRPLEERRSQKTCRKRKRNGLTRIRSHSGYQRLPDGQPQEPDEVTPQSPPGLFLFPRDTT
jgi:hypothetical protein